MLRIARIISLGALVVGINACDHTEDDLSLRYYPSTTAPPTDTYPDEHDTYPDDPPSDPTDDVCGYRTQTQGGWGSACHGDNPGCFRDANFKKAFPWGLKIGCGKHTAHFKNSLAVEKALPTGGKPAPLKLGEIGDYDGEGDHKIGTVLAGQTTALSLSVGFSELAAYVSQDITPFAKLVLAEGECAGMTVQEVLDAANDALGGCYSTLSPGRANACATLINESFVDGEPECSETFTQPPYSTR